MMIKENSVSQPNLLNTLNLCFIALCLVLIMSTICITSQISFSDDGNSKLHFLSIVSVFSIVIVVTIIQLKKKFNDNFLILRADRDKANNLKRRYRNFAEAEIYGHEAERLRLARELHDDTIHRLIILGQQIELLKYDQPENPMVNDLNRLVGIVDDGIDHIRSVIKELRPFNLATRGIIPEIRSLINENTGNDTCEFKLESNGNEYRLNNDVELTLYRLTQTSLQNIRLHSKATNVVVKVTFSEDKIVLLIEDNGAGFEVPNESELFENGHFGLLGMKERAQLCNGTFMIHSIEGTGTCITVEIPKYGNEPIEA